MVFFDQVEEHKRKSKNKKNTNNNVPKSKHYHGQHQ